MASSVLVSGAGTVAVNGTYTLSGTFDSKPYYNIEGWGADTVHSCVIWAFSNTWVIVAANGFPRYSATEDVAFPWLVSVWANVGGSDPVPTVTESFVPSTAVSGATQISGATKLT